MNGVLGFFAEWGRAIISLSSLGTLGVALQFYRVWRAGRTSDEAQRQSALKLDQDGDGAIRDHYATELTALREQIIKSGNAHAEREQLSAARHREQLTAADERFRIAMEAADGREAECQRQVRGLREEVQALSEEIIGLRHQLGQSSRSAIILAATAPSLPIREAADRAADAIGAVHDGIAAIPHHERSANDGD